MVRPALLRVDGVADVVSAALGLTLWTFPRLGSEFLPELNEGGLYLTFTLPSNISLTEGRNLVPKLTERIRSHPQVDGVVSQLGRPEDGTDPALANNLEFFVKLTPPETWPKETPTIDRVIAALRDSVSIVPGLEVNFSQPIRDNVAENISGQFGQIALKLYGEDLVALQKQAEKVKAAIAKIEGVADLGIVKSGRAAADPSEAGPQRPGATRHGSRRIQHVFQTALGGRPVASFWEGERRFDVVMLDNWKRGDVCPDFRRSGVDAILKGRNST